MLVVELRDAKGEVDLAARPEQGAKSHTSATGAQIDGLTGLLGVGHHGHREGRRVASVDSSFKEHGRSVGPLPTFVHNLLKETLLLGVLHREFSHSIG